MTNIAIVGMACRYPDATSPRELWENALAGRRAFRRLPDVRMRLDDYWDADPATVDRFYASKAAVIDGYQFDRVAYKVAGSTYRSTDLTHWLALDVAALALADAGFPMAEGLPRERTGVVVGNTLTGEFSRANQLRLRWPYVRRTVTAALKDQDWDDDQLAKFLDEFEASFKSPFPAVDEDTLAGGLSNTIAGRICNHFDLKGGGYTVDGACSSSLLSVATACKALIDGDVDVAVAGGVDLSLDPFELIGFAKAGALATGEMRVYDRGSNGFWPGEGCGMVVLMRESDAKQVGHRSYATVAGWGISSDGKGGITRPELSGYQLALRRAYERAGFGIDTVALFEGHGTGTKVGDAVELRALSMARVAANPEAAPAAIGSIKGMIGHTKAAAGVAGLIKAAMAVHRQVLPPTIGCVDPHEVLTESTALRMLRKAEPWPDGMPVRAGITAMGFGGINIHVVLENAGPRRRVPMDTRTRALASSIQDVELLLVEAGSTEQLRERVTQLIDFVPSLAYAQLSDLAASMHRELRGLPYRAAVVVASPDDAVLRLRIVADALAAGERALFAPERRSYLGRVSGPARLGFLVPGQGSGRGTGGGALRRRFAEADEIYVKASLPSNGDMVATEVAQPRIVTASMAGLRVLSMLGLDATVAIGHSLGELTALQWAGAMDEEALLRVAAVRGRTMAAHSASGTMANVGASAEAVGELLAGHQVVIAAYNGPRQTVIAGSVEAVRAACRRASSAGLSSTPLSVSHAFHSPQVAPAAAAFGVALGRERFGPIGRKVISTVVGSVLAGSTNVADLLRRQITDPVLFAQAVALAAKEVDLFVEVGPGRVLTGLAGGCTDLPVIALDTDDESLASLLGVVGAAYVIGACGVDAALFHGRPTRPIQVGDEFSFFANPCEQAPTAVGRGGTGALARATRSLDATAETETGTRPDAGTTVVGGDLAREAAEEPTTDSTVDMLRGLAARRAELPLDMVRPGSRLLDDLHLSSITVGQVVNQAAQRLGIPLAEAPTNFATATVSELADALDALAGTAGPRDHAAAPPVSGAAQWVRAFRIDLDEAPLPPRSVFEDGAGWRVYADADHPLAEPLRRALENGRLGTGVLVCLPVDCTEQHLRYALDGAQAAIAGQVGARYVLVQHGRGAAGLCKTLRLEAPHLRTTIVNVVPQPEAVDWVVAEVAATTGFAEAYYDSAGVRRVPTLRAMPIRPARAEQPLNGSDVLLVTGGGMGITAECALAMALDSGAKLAVLGRSDPAQNGELAANLTRMAGAGVTVHYAQADVTDAEQVRRAVGELTDALGPVSAVLHGAGRNEPGALTTLDLAAFRRTLAPKLDGLAAVLSAVEPDRLRLLVTFGSIIGRSGLRGEAHYATANEWLAERTREFAERYPLCRALCIEWSVWSGVGMGERLSVVETLSRDGITPISPDQGVAVLRRLLSDPDTPLATVVTGRTEDIDTIRRDLPDLPLLRFIEKPLIRYHGVELIVEVELNAGTDPYLADHLLDGNLLFPAVIGMEAMAQVAVGLAGHTGVPVFEQAEFLRPIVVAPHASVVIRVAAALTDDDTVDVVIRSAETDYGVDHFRARLRFHAGDAPDGPPGQVSDELPISPLRPATDLYGDILFQGTRFQRLRAYHRAAARDVDADVVTVDSTLWFAPYLPGTLLLGDPGVRDALMHGNQVCVPDATLLPAGIERVYPAGARMGSAVRLRYCATERSRDGDTYVYDIVLRTSTGEVIERWEGLRLRAVRKRDGRGPWVAPLLGPYLERTLGDLLGARLAVAVEPDQSEPDDVAVSSEPVVLGDAEPAWVEPGAAEPTLVEPAPPEGRPMDHLAQRRARTAVAAARVLGRPVEVRYRPDGRPEIDGEVDISAAHGAGLTMCVAGSGAVGCDLEVVASRPSAVWQGLLGPHMELAQLTAATAGEDVDTAATRVWAAIECLTKAGRSPRGPIILQPAQRAGWTVFSSGNLRIAAFATSVRGLAAPVVFALLTEERR